MSENNGVAHHLTELDIVYLQQLSSQGQISEAWAYLAQKGDAYAVLAADVVKAEPETQVGKTFNLFVELRKKGTDLFIKRGLPLRWCLLRIEGNGRRPALLQACPRIANKKPGHLAGFSVSGRRVDQ